MSGHGTGKNRGKGWLEGEEQKEPARRCDEGKASGPPPLAKGCESKKEQKGHLRDGGPRVYQTGYQPSMRSTGHCPDPF